MYRMCVCVCIVYICICYTPERRWRNPPAAINYNNDWNGDDDDGERVTLGIKDVTHSGDNVKAEKGSKEIYYYYYRKYNITIMILGENNVQYTHDLYKIAVYCVLSEIHNTYMTTANAQRGRQIVRTLRKSKKCPRTFKSTKNHYITSTWQRLVQKKSLFKFKVNDFNDKNVLSRFYKLNERDQLDFLPALLKFKRNFFNLSVETLFLSKTMISVFVSFVLSNL